MTTRERTIVFGLLTLLGLINLIALMGSDAGRPAHAATPAHALDSVGPVDSVVLAGAGDDVTLVNRDGRLAWGEDEADRAYSTAYVFIGKILNQLMQSDDRTETRQALVDELTKEEQNYREQMDTIRERGMQMDQESDEFRETYEQYVAEAEKFREWQQTAITQRGALDAEQLEAAYRELIDAVEVVADRRDIDMVYRFIPTEDAFNADNPDQALLAIRLRPALRYPTELDITDAVLEELALSID